MRIISLFNPVSQEYHSIRDFSHLTGRQQAKAVVYSALAALASLPILGVGGVAAFRATVTKYTDRNLAAAEILAPPPQPVIHYLNDVTNTDGLDDVENDGNPVQNYNFRESAMASLKLERLYRSDHLLAELENGEFHATSKNLFCGLATLPTASVVRAAKQGKVIEDQLFIDTFKFHSALGNYITVSFILSCDGNKNNALSLFYKQRAPTLFNQFVQAELSKGIPMGSELVTDVLKRIEDKIITEEWPKHEMAGRSNSTVNMLCIFPTREARYNGAFLGRGDTRSLILRANGEVCRIGAYKEGESIGTFALAPGDMLFTSSDGIWHNASPNDVNELIRSDLEQGKSLLETLEHLVATTLPGRDDDRNPVLIQIPL